LGAWIAHELCFRTKAREVAEGAAHRAVESQTRGHGATAKHASPDEVGVEDALADDKPTSGLQHAAELAQRSLLVGHLAQHLDEERGVERAVLEWERGRIRARGDDVRQTLPLRLAHRVVEPFGDHVDDRERAAGRDPAGDGQRVVARPGADLEHALAWLGLEDLPQALAPERLRPEHAERFAALRRGLGRLVEQQARQLGLSLRLSPDEVGAAVVALADGLALQRLADPAAFSDDLLATLLATLIPTLADTR
jgi:hypothetical protein